MSVCEFCGGPALPGDPDVGFAISGFEFPRVGGGANMVHLRHRLGPVAHRRCVEDAKPRQAARRRAEQPSIDLTTRAHGRAR